MPGELFGWITPAPLPVLRPVRASFRVAALSLHGVLQLSQELNLCDEDIPVPEEDRGLAGEARAGRCAVRDQITRLQREDLGDRRAYATGGRR